MRKVTGGIWRKSRKKKKRERVRQVRYIRLEKEKRKEIRTRGGNLKIVLLSSNKANVLDKKTGKIKEAWIKKILKSQVKDALVKGAIIETELGNAKITNKPSREGHIDAILIE